MTIQLGAKYKDRITGFEGRATGHVRYITGCNQVLLAPTVRPDGSLAESVWLDEQRLQLTSEPDDVVVLNNGATPGPDRPAPIR